MNEKNDTHPVYPLESIDALRRIHLCIISPQIESEDQLAGLLEELQPALDKWIEASGVEDKGYGCSSI